VLLEVPGGTYWHSWQAWVTSEVESRRLIAPADRSFYLITDSVDAAAAEILGFYRNYHSLRFVGATLVIRLQARPTDDELARLSDEFADIRVGGTIEALDRPLPPEARSDDNPHLPRIAFKFDRMSYARLRMMIDALNRLASAPAMPVVAPAAESPASPLAGWIAPLLD
jgi:hypothetical protein